MKILTLTQLAIVILGGLLTYVCCGAAVSGSYLIGAILILVNFLLFWISWKLIFAQKFVALSIGVIVFKYAILGIIIFKLVKKPWVDLLWFSIGIATFLIPSIVYAINEALNKQEEV